MLKRMFESKKLHSGIYLAFVLINLSALRSNIAFQQQKTDVRAMLGFPPESTDLRLTKNVMSSSPRVNDLSTIETKPSVLAEDMALLVSETRRKQSSNAEEPLENRQQDEGLIFERDYLTVMQDLLNQSSIDTASEPAAVPAPESKTISTATFTAPLFEIPEKILPIKKEEDQSNIISTIMTILGIMLVFQRRKRYQITSQDKRVYFSLLLLSISPEAQTRHFECSVEQIADQDFCVFRNVQLKNNNSEVTFGFPGSIVPSIIAFENCSMTSLPVTFWDTFRDNLTVLEAEKCGFKSINITEGLEVLRIGDNYLKLLIVQQNCNLTELDVSGNKFGDLQSLSVCPRLKVDIASALSSIGDPNLHILLKPSMLYFLNDTDNLYITNLYTNKTSLSDSKPNVFLPLCILQMLKLNNNALERIENQQLKSIKSLDPINIKGTLLYWCYDLKDSFNIATQLDIAMPPKERDENCQSNDDDELMCCFPPPPTQKPTESTPTVPTTSTSDTRVTSPQEEDDASNMDWIAWIAIAAVIVIVGLLVGRWFYNKGQRQEWSPGNVELNNISTNEPIDAKDDDDGEPMTN